MTPDPLYLSRLILDPYSRQVRNELAQPYEMHRTLMHAFEKYQVGENEKLREKLNILFRANVDDQCNRVIAYVQSAAKPDWSFLTPRGNYLLANFESPNPICKDVAEAYQRLQSGQVFSFLLRANPTKRIAKPAKGDGELKGKRVGLLREEEQIEWLVRKSSDCGFEILTKKGTDDRGKIGLIPHINVCREGKQKGYKRVEKRPHAITHLTVLFDGLLRITDADAFRRSLAHGIGPAKAFGCGLLSIARC